MNMLAEINFSYSRNFLKQKKQNCLLRGHKGACGNKGKNPIIYKLCTKLQVVILKPRPVYLRYSLFEEAGLVIELVLTNAVIW